MLDLFRFSDTFSANEELCDMSIPSWIPWKQQVWERKMGHIGHIMISWKQFRKYCWKLFSLLDTEIVSNMSIPKVKIFHWSVGTTHHVLSWFCNGLQRISEIIIFALIKETQIEWQSLAFFVWRNRKVFQYAFLGFYPEDSHTPHKFKLHIQVLSLPLFLCGWSVPSKLLH